MLLFGLVSLTVASNVFFCFRHFLALVYSSSLHFCCHYSGMFMRDFFKFYTVFVLEGASKEYSWIFVCGKIVSGIFKGEQLKILV